MKESYLKSSIIWLIIGLIVLAVGFIAPFVFEILHAYEIPVGVIAGGIDFPSYQDMIFNHWHGFWSILIHLGGAMILTACFALLFRKTVQKCCGRITSLLAIGLSILGSACLVSLLYTLATSGSDHMHYPHANLIATVCVIVSALIYFLLFVSYIYNRFKRFSLCGLLLDMLLTIVYLPSFWWFWGVLMEFARYALQNVI